MASFVPKRRPLILLILLFLGYVLASPALAQSAWEPTNPFEFRWPDPEPRRLLLDPPWQLYEIRWPELDLPRWLHEIQLPPPESQWQSPEIRWPSLDLPRQLDATPWLSERHWRSDDVRLRNRERALLSYLDRRNNPYQQYLSDKAQQDLVRGGLVVKRIGMTLVEPTGLAVLGLVISGIRSITAPDSAAHHLSTASGQAVDFAKLGIDDHFAPLPVLFTGAEWILSDWASHIVKQDYISSNSLYSHWMDDDLANQTTGSTVILNVESFQPGTPPRWIGPVDFFDGKYERRTITSSTYHLRARGGLHLTQSDLDALERGSGAGLLSGFRIEPGSPRDLGAGDPSNPKNRSGVDIDVELKETEAQDSGLYEAVIDARPSSDAPFWDFTLSDPNQKEKDEKNEKGKEELP